MFGRSAYQLVELGMALLLEGRGVVGCLSVEEDLQMGAHVTNGCALIRCEVDRIHHLFPH